jgi:hypothetical protein
MSRNIVRHDGAHANQIEPPRRGFCPSNMPAAQDALAGETLPEEEPLFPLRLANDIIKIMDIETDAWPSQYGSH